MRGPPLPGRSWLARAGIAPWYAGRGESTPPALLAWPAPDTTGFTVVNVPTTGYTSQLDHDTDYVFNMPASPVTAPVWMKGGRNIVVIGGEIKVDSITYDGSGGANESTQQGIYIIRHDTAGVHAGGRIIHIEGVLIHGYGMSDPIRTASNNGGPTDVDLRLQNIRAEQGMWYRDFGRDGTGSPHPDLIQPFGGLAHLRLDGFTGLVTGQGFMLKPDFNGPNQGGMSFRRTNVREQDSPDANAAGGGIEYTDSGATWPTPTTGTPGPRYLWWVQNDGGVANGDEGPISIEGGTVWFNHPDRTFAGDNIFWPEGGTVDSDGVGTYAVPPGDTYAWDGTPLARIYEGNPPAGDYVRAADVGIGYTSPGYDADLQHAAPQEPEFGTITVVGSSSQVGFSVTHTHTVPADAEPNDLVLIFAVTSRFPATVDPNDLTSEEFLTGTASADSKLIIFRGTVGTDLAASENVVVGEIGGSGQNRATAMATLRSSNGQVPTVTDFGGGRDFLATTGDTAPTAPSIVLPGPGLLLFVTSAAAAASSTPPSGYTELRDVNRTLAALMVATKVVTEAGTSGAATSTLSTGGAWNALHIHAYSETTP